MIGERLQELRKDHGLSQREFGEKLNLSPHTISSYERNCSEPKDEIKIKIAKIFDISLDYLLGLTDQCCSYRHDEDVIVLSDMTEEERKEAKLFCEYLKYRRK